MSTHGKGTAEKETARALADGEALVLFAAVEMDLSLKLLLRAVCNMAQSLLNSGIISRLCLGLFR